MSRVRLLNVKPDNFTYYLVFFAVLDVTLYRVATDSFLKKVYRFSYMFKRY